MGSVVKKRLEMRFAGYVAVDTHYSTHFAQVKSLELMEAKEELDVFDVWYI